VTVLALLSTACSSTRAPSFVERCAIDDGVARYEQSRDGDLLATTAPEAFGRDMLTAAMQPRRTG
jgi:hypothetical protein